MKNIAIVVIAYNREKSLARLLNSISRAYIDEDTTLIISIDKSNNPLVLQYANAFEWQYGEKRVIAHPENLGLKKHILGCGNFLQEYEAIIVLEDDLVVSANFYQYAKQTVNFYSDALDIAGISLYGFSTNYQTFYPFHPCPSEYDVYFMKCAQSWGQIWLRKQWLDFVDWYNREKDTVFNREYLPNALCSWSEKSWLKYHTRYCIETNKYFVYPYLSHSSNSGECGEHLVFSTPVFQNVLAKQPKNYCYRLISLNASLIKYDGFFELEHIYEVLGLDEKQLCIDLTRSKKTYTNRRYLLSVKSLNFKVIQSFGLSYSPIELNIIESCPGNFIYLYDTFYRDKKPRNNDRQIFAYYNKVDIIACVRRVFHYGIYNLLKLFLKKI